MQKHEATSVGLGTRESETQSVFARSLCAMEVRFAAGKATAGANRFTGVTLPGIGIFKDEGIGTRNYVRSARHIDHEPLDEYIYVLQVSAGSIVYQGGTQTVRTPGTATLMTPSRPFSGCISSESFNGKFTGLVAKIAGPAFRQRVPEIDRYLGHPLQLPTFSNHISRHLLETALADAANVSAADSRYLGLTLIDAIANATREAIEQMEPPLQLRRSSLARVHEEAAEFIARNLADSRLSIEGIARHCGVSERYLQKAFALFSGPVGEYIREARLQACQRDMLDPRLADKKLRDIAVDHGFASLAYFSRAYRARFDTSPSHHRLSGTL